MTRMSNKWVSLRSVPHSIEQNLAHGIKVEKLSVAQIADRMSLPSHWGLYKYQENGRMPAILIPSFEAACGINLVTRYLAHSAHKILIDIPTGRKVSSIEVHELQAAFTTAVGLLLQFYACGEDADQTKGALTSLLEGVAWHRKNIDSYVQPGFELGVAR